jgi:hypothetical protein
MKVYMIATNEPMVTRMDTFDEHGNVRSDEISLYLHRADAEKAVSEYNDEISGDSAWIVKVEVKEKY